MVYCGNGEGGEEEIIEDWMFFNEDFINFLLDECVLKEFFKELFLFIDVFEYRGFKEFVVEKDVVFYW